MSVARIPAGGHGIDGNKCFRDGELIGLRVLAGDVHVKRDVRSRVATARGRRQREGDDEHE